MQNEFYILIRLSNAVLVYYLFKDFEYHINTSFDDEKEKSKNWAMYFFYNNSSLVVRKLYEWKYGK